jgi:lipid II:glycine glycyltransferase (peptidoglycan interpeptide bridge formation enzyme)
MIEFINGFDAEYENFNSVHPKGTVFQSYLWSGVKPAWSWAGIKVRRDGALTGVMGVLIRPIPMTGYTLMYAPRGPVADEGDIQTLSQLTEGIKTLAKRRRAYVFKVDSDVVYENEAYRNVMLDLGYRLLPAAMEFDNIQPQFVARLDIAGKSEDEIMAEFKNKTRYNIRLAIRHKVRIQVCGQEGLGDFYPIMISTGRRDGFIIRSREYFDNMFDALGEHVRLYMAYYEDIPIAGAICVNYGSKTWYQYGASANEHRDKMPNYLLQWQMIRWAVEMKSTVYDFRGVSGNPDPNSPHYGLWKFKRGFGAQMVKLAGEFEYVFHPGVYRFMKIYIPTMQRLSRSLTKAFSATDRDTK